MTSFLVPAARLFSGRSDSPQVRVVSLNVEAQAPHRFVARPGDSTTI